MKISILHYFYVCRERNQDYIRNSLLSITTGAAVEGFKKLLAKSDIHPACDNFGGGLVKYPGWVQLVKPEKREQGTIASPAIKRRELAS
ncbi:MAG: hypothetical protein ABI659_05215 [Nitrosospira sp.]